MRGQQPDESGRSRRTCDGHALERRHRQTGNRHPAILLFLLCLGALPGGLRAEDAIGTNPQHLFLIRPGFGFYSFQLELGPVGNDTRIRYVPNVPLIAELGLAYDWIRFTVSIPLPIDQPQRSLRGDSECLDLQLSLRKRHWGLDLCLQVYQGYSIDNPEVVDPAWSEGQAHPHYPDLITIHYAIGWLYAFADDYSLKAAHDCSERQRRSAGSFLCYASASMFALDNGSASIMPAGIGPHELQGFRAGTFITLAAGPGYAHTFVAGRFFVGLHYLLALGRQFRELRSAAGNRQDDAFGLRHNLRFSTGWNWDDAFLKLALQTEEVIIESGDSELVASSLAGTLALGIRL